MARTEAANAMIIEVETEPVISVRTAHAKYKGATRKGLTPETLTN